ncbi:putative formimidoylglutamase, partial [Vibrio parahaemolyticus VPTS-2010]
RRRCEKQRPNWSEKSTRFDS